MRQINPYTLICVRCFLEAAAHCYALSNKKEAEKELDECIRFIEDHHTKSIETI